jgi:gamma-glutamylcyclotransferase (GGCT)/AIG2-like uncharacterized protein YtfP
MDGMGEEIDRIRAENKLCGGMGQGKFRLGRERDGWHNGGMNESADLTVFVYGTLKPGGRAWARLCEGKVADAKPARVRGRLYHLSAGYPALRDESQNAEGAAQESSGDPIRAVGETNWVHGWRLILRDAAALHGFDEWEEFDPARNPGDNTYNRIKISFFSDAKNTTEPSKPEILGEAWVYAMAASRIAAMGGVEVPGGEWVDPAVANDKSGEARN